MSFARSVHHSATYLNWLLPCDWREWASKSYGGEESKYKALHGSGTDGEKTVRVVTTLGRKDTRHSMSKSVPVT